MGNGHKWYQVDNLYKIRFRKTTDCDNDKYAYDWTLVGVFRRLSCAAGFVLWLLSDANIYT
ncbi:MAG: hypothetical protein LUF89_11860 [Ruminococcus sp.]|nr:hypothetical protein [Ruminococcus sp.]